MNRMLRISFLRKGFTLIELLVVILILGILAALIVPKVISRTSDAKIAAAKTDLSNIKTALDSFRVDCDRYPTADEGLQALVTAPSGLEGKWKSPYLSQVPVDPWQHAYVYKYPGNNGNDSYVVESYGADGQEGGDGDNADIVDGN